MEQPLWKRPGFWQVGILLGAVAHSAYYYPRLPERMATHFGADGRANGWMSKDGFVAFELGLTTFLAGLWSGIGWILPRIPDEAINLPNKRYWLAPERREQTLRDMSRFLSHFGIANTLFLLTIHQQVIKTNLRGDNYLGGVFWALLGIYLTCTLWQVVALVQRYGRLPEGEK